MSVSWGNTLLIANPAAQNGRSASLIDKAAGYLRGKLPHGTFDVQPTHYAGHAREIAETVTDVDTILVLGGDGIAHEAVNGLMQRAEDNRPTLGIIPVGSGNDLARTLRIPDDITAACDTLLAADVQLSDVGRVNNEYFIETLSFGLDAAIALDTVERRKKTGKRGTILYMESGFDQLLHHLDSYEYILSVDGSTPVEGKSITFAVQNGPYYGGGFKICPDASLTDGALDICIAHPPVGVAKACFIFLQAKDGRHTRMKQMELFRATSLYLTFEKHPPTQADGEYADGTTFDIRICPATLPMLMPSMK